MARCTERACVNQAIAGGDKCLPHRLKRAEEPKRVDGKEEFEIVSVAAIPSLVIKNPKNHRIINAIAVLKDGHALKVARNGNGRNFSHTIQDACRKRGIKGVHSRRSLDAVYFWKDPETKSAGAKG